MTDAVWTARIVRLGFAQWQAEVQWADGITYMVYALTERALQRKIRRYVESVQEIGSD